jgi:hypothetical protein
MTRALLAISGSATALLPRPLLNLGHAFDTVWHRLGHRIFNGYHPERHYMRGPGPAWHAKHGPTA